MTTKFDNVISLTVAGGGKTTMLLEHIKKLKTNRILVFSFTNASALDIERRLEVPIKVFTLHGFCASLLNYNGLIIETHEHLTSLFIHDYVHISKYGVSLVNNWVETYMLFRNYANIQHLPPEDQELNKELMHLIQQINEEKKRSNLLGFSDIIYEFIDNFQNIIAQIGESYDHICVDEAQDLSSLQLDLLYHIILNCFSDEDKSFFIVGDINQCIYDFQGASPIYYSNFIEKLRKISRNNLIYIEQPITYRFGGDILNFINNNMNSIQHISYKTTGKVIYEDFHTPESLETYVQNLFPTLENDTMIIYHNMNTHIVKLQNNLVNCGVDLKIYLEYQPLVESLWDIYHYLNSHNNYYRIRILQGLFHYINEPDLYNLHLNNNLYTYFNGWFEELRTKRKAIDILDFIVPYLKTNELNQLLFQELYTLAVENYSFQSFVLKLPHRLRIKQPNAIFSTIHSAKGLEAHNVIYVKYPLMQQKFYVNLNEFFVTRFPQKLAPQMLKHYEESINNNSNYNNLLYVAYSRAKENLYILNLLPEE